jgi:hypothetical protein
MPLRTQTGTPVKFVEVDEPGATLNVPQIMQEQSNWCWAACAVMVFQYYGINAGTQQCDLANYLSGQTYCCTPATFPPTDPCNQPCPVSPIDNISGVYSHYGVTCARATGPITFSAIQSEIGANRPIELFFAWNTGGGHVVLVVGWGSDANGDYVRVNDPNAGSGGVTYAQLLAYTTGSAFGSWNFTWTGIQPVA